MSSFVLFFSLIDSSFLCLFSLDSTLHGKVPSTQPLLPNPDPTYTKPCMEGLLAVDAALLPEEDPTAGVTEHDGASVATAGTDSLSAPEMQPPPVIVGTAAAVLDTVTVAPDSKESVVPGPKGTGPGKVDALQPCRVLLTPLAFSPSDRSRDYSVDNKESPRRGNKKKMTRARNTRAGLLSKKVETERDSRCTDSPVVFEGVDTEQQALLQGEENDDVNVDTGDTVQGKELIADLPSTSIASTSFATTEASEAGTTGNVAPKERGLVFESNNNLTAGKRHVHNVCESVECSETAIVCHLSAPDAKEKTPGAKPKPDPDKAPVESPVKAPAVRIKTEDSGSSSMSGSTSRCSDDFSDMSSVHVKLEPLNTDDVPLSEESNSGSKRKADSGWKADNDSAAANAEPKKPKDSSNTDGGGSPAEKTEEPGLLRNPSANAGEEESKSQIASDLAPTMVSASSPSVANPDCSPTKAATEDPAAEQPAQPGVTESSFPVTDYKALFSKPNQTQLPTSATSSASSKEVGSAAPADVKGPVQTAIKGDPRASKPSAIDPRQIQAIDKELQKSSLNNNKGKTNT